MEFCFILKPGDWRVEFSVRPFSWYFKPWKLGSWDNPDFDSLTECNIDYLWLCFSVRFEKKMHLRLGGLNNESD
jgi:hypothetical protein